MNRALEHAQEEQDRATKYDTMRKALEVQVKELQVRLQEMEANALVGGKRLVSKLEARVSIFFFTYRYSCRVPFDIVLFVDS